MIDTAAKATSLDQETRDWIRNPSDVRAAENGCFFDVLQGSYAVWWIERYCRLYEGEQAGQRMYLRGCAQCQNSTDVPDEWDDAAKALYYQRAVKYSECVKAGHQTDWQHECTMRCFGWVRYSEKWRRNIRRFREASIWIAKKNKKSPTLAAWALYLLIGDGEQGQKVFIAAKDGNQARDIGAKHAAEMVRLSPELSEACRINKVRASIRHTDTRSDFMPLSSSNSATQRSKEGLNGSIVVDEVHVVDRDFISIISRAGISRSEPMFAGFSTAGDNLDGYGKERFDYSEKVLKGEIEDQSLFVAIYAAPQNLSDEDLEQDPLKYGLMANPAMGHTVDRDEYLEDYRKSKHSPRELSRFKMYRLNIWQASETPWLNMDYWRKNERQYTAEDLAGKSCWAGLDLSATKDFTALCLMFPEDDGTYRGLWYYWLPEETANAYRTKIDIDRWLKDPRVNLTLTEGATVHYGYIRSHMRKLHEIYKIQELAYDDWNAEQTTQEIEQGVTNMNGVVIEQATYIPRFNFTQSLRHLNEPTKSFEVDIIRGKLLHNGDPLTTWMIGNTMVKPDVNGNIRPVKPKRNGINKIDGTVAAIMARARASAGNNYSAISMAFV